VNWRVIFVTLIGIWCSIPSEARVLVITTAHNRPNFVELQQRTLQHFMLDNYEYVVFNDARIQADHDALNQKCKQLDIRCLPVPQELHDVASENRENLTSFRVSLRNCTAIQHALETIGFDHDDIVMLLDSDMFPIKPFNAHSYLQSFHLAGYKYPLHRDHGSIDGHIWIGLVLIDMPHLPNRRTLNFYCGLFDGEIVDSGGHTAYYLRDNDVRVRWFKKELLHLVPSSPCELYMDGTFLHYAGGTNYFGASQIRVDQKTAAVKKKVAEAIENYSTLTKVIS